MLHPCLRHRAATACIARSGRTVAAWPYSLECHGMCISPRTAAMQLSDWVEKMRLNHLFLLHPSQPQV